MNLKNNHELLAPDGIHDLEKDNIFALTNKGRLLIFSLNHLLGNNYMIGENFAVRRSAYDKIGGFNPSLITAEDVDLGYRIQKVGKCLYDPKLVALTSNRRLAHEKLGFFTHHIANFIRFKLTGVASTNFKPVR